MAIKTIFWDIGGVLERTEDPAPRKAIAAELGWEIHDLARLLFGHSDNFRIQLGQITMDQHSANIARSLGITRDELSNIITAFFAGDRLDRELVTHIRQLRKDYQIGVISNYTPILRPKINDLWQIGDTFDTLTISSEVGVMKPEEAIYQIALEKADTRPEQAVFIDDFIENVGGAQKVGMHAIHFRSASQTLDELHNLLDQT